MAGFLDLIPGLSPIVDKVLAFIPDPQQRAKAQTELLDFFSKADLGQLEVNKAEAMNASVFVAGWRPAIGWVCATALAYQYIIRPLATGLFDVLGVHHAPVLIGLDGNLWELMFAMLGLGGLRSLEKIKGVGK